MPIAFLSRTGSTGHTEESNFDQFLQNPLWRGYSGGGPTSVQALNACHMPHIFHLSGELLIQLSWNLVATLFNISCWEFQVVSKSGLSVCTSPTCMSLLNLHIYLGKHFMIKHATLLTHFLITLKALIFNIQPWQDVGYWPTSSVQYHDTYTFVFLMYWCFNMLIMHCAGQV